MKPIGLNIKNNVAYLGNHNLYDLAKQYQTPLYVMDEEQVVKNIFDYVNNFKSNYFNTTIVYASKAFLTFLLTVKSVSAKYSLLSE